MLVKELGKESKIATLESTNNINKIKLFYKNLQKVLDNAPIWCIIKI